MIKKKKMFSLREEFYLSLKYISESRKYIYFSIFLFFFGTLMGFILAPQLGIFDLIIAQLAALMKDLHGIDLIVFIFRNNFMASLLALALGLFFGLFSILVCFSNGMLLGYVFNKVYLVSGISEFWKILPHGIFEIPAVLISVGLGIKFGFFIFSRKPFVELRARAFESLRVFFLVVVPLLVVAAIIEGVLINLIR